MSCDVLNSFPIMWIFFKELKLIHAISKLPGNILDQRGEPINGSVAARAIDHSDIVDIKYV